EMHITGAGLINPRAGDTSLVDGDVVVQSVVQSVTAPIPDPHRHPHLTPVSLPSGFQLAPTTLALGGKDPATLDGRFDTTGYTLHLTGMASAARLHALAVALPQFGDGLAEVLPTNRAAGPFRVDLTATRPWGEAQTWTDNTARPVSPKPRPRRRS
ncbi:MAG TPA: hypothetical protein VH117_06205, partial [Edaphobacter sp.]|nr:hypothetical protein [Edaphobacter sp.]